MIIGTAGHIDHGKTALVRALTGVETDRLKEEKARGITIELGFAYRTLPGGTRVGFVDVPGHERFVHTMLAGAGGIDLALLVVAADDGIMPQSREHLAIIDLLGIRRGIIALTKADLADGARLATLRAEVAALTGGTVMADCPILPVSTVTGIGLAELEAALAAEAGALSARDAEGGRFRLAVDRSFVIHGAGTVVTGTVLSGAVTVGDMVTVSPSGLSARVRGIRRLDQPADRASVGDRAALNLSGDGIARNVIERGEVILDTALHAPTGRIDARLRLLPAVGRPLGQWAPVHLHPAATMVPAHLVLLDAEAVAPGQTVLAQVVLDRPIAAAAGDRFVLRDTSARHTIGGGLILDLRPPLRRRRTPERLAQLGALALPDPKAAVAGLLAGPPHAVALDDFARDRALSLARREAIGDGLMRIGPAVLSPGHWRGMRDAILARIDRAHAEHPDELGVGLDRLRLLVEPRPALPLFRDMLARLQAEGALTVDSGRVRRPGHAPRLTERDEALWFRIWPQVTGEARFRPPRTRDLAGIFGAPEEDMRKLLKRAARMGRVHEVAHDSFFATPVLAEIVAILIRIEGASGRPFSAADLRDQLQNGRKVAIEILEFLDRHGVTRRRGDLRRLDPRRIDLFGPPPFTGTHAGDGPSACA